MVGSGWADGAQTESLGRDFRVISDESPGFLGNSFWLSASDAASSWKIMGERGIFLRHLF